jgi:hypothetical protein
MDPVTMVIVPGFLGGLVIALLVIRSHRRGRADLVVVPYRPERPSTDVINMASIKVAGIGGLGLVAMAAAVALDVPQIGQSMAVGLGCGLIIAGVLIYRARRAGPMPSSGQRMGANTVLSIDRPDETDENLPADRRLDIRLATTD